MIDPFYFTSYAYFRKNDWFELNPDWITAICTVISTIAIVLTAYWAKKSFWYTAEKDRRDRTVEFIEKIYFTDLTNDIREIARFDSSADPVVEYLKNGHSWEEVSIKFTPKIQNILNILNLFGVLLSENKVDLEMFYRVFRSDMKIVWEKCKFLFDDVRTKDITIWEDYNYLHNKFLELDKINQNKI